jgi:urease accessory protein
MKTAKNVARDRSRPHTAVVTLDFEHRQKHRFLTTLAGGGELAVHLPRGTVLADGDVLETDDGESVLVRAADEDLSVAETPDVLLLTRVAYHLGNRHVALQIEPGRVSYLHDHVLDDLARRLGAEVGFRRAPFSPESGAYGHGGTHRHDHDHSHGHQHLHARIHGHENGAKGH